MTSTPHVHPSTEHGLATLPEHLHGFALTHMAMRRDAARLAALAGGHGAVRAGAAPPWSTVADWWDHLRRTIEWHHHSEDDILWPQLRQAVPDLAGPGSRLAAVLDEDHTALDEAMAAVTAALAAPDPGAALAPAAAHFARLLPEHLDREEQVVFPAFIAMGRARYLAVERQVIGSAGPGLLAFVLPWMFDGFDRRQTGRAADTIPAPVRLLSSTVLRRRYARLRTGW